MKKNSTDSPEKKGGFWNELFKFGPSRQEIWQQLSKEIDAKYVDGGFWETSKVQLTYGTWTITFDLLFVGKSRIPHTRFRAPYVNNDGFRFNIYRAGFFSRLGVKLGMQDVQIGDEQFDNDFIVQGTNETKLREFLSSKRLRELIAMQPNIEFSVRDSEGWFGPPFPDNVDELIFLSLYEVRDIAKLKTLFELFMEALEQLYKIGSAYKQDPRVTL